MKKLVLTTLVAIALISSAFAAPTKNVARSIKYAFENAFPAATNVDWKVTDVYTKAMFEIDGVRTDAFYDAKGNFLGSSHTVSIDQLPVGAKRSFAKKYSTYTVTEVIQFEGVEETAYYISAKNEKETVVLKVADNKISIFSSNK